MAWFLQLEVKEVIKITELNVVVSNTTDPVQLLQQNKWQVEEVQRLYYPYYFFEVQIEYDSFLRKKRFSKKMVAVNAVTGGTSFSDVYPTFEKRDISDHATVPMEYSAQDCQKETIEMVRKYFIHHVRIWNPPTITVSKTEAIYLPYTVLYTKKANNKKSYLHLYEHLSGKYDKLNNSPMIENAFNNLFKRSEAT
ncbi:hypothetical protein ABE096_06115 [Robertmurraya massiliosenegalensis]|uniref:hypothetical protein n=1 Tax=Robertmurraya massiliosenegalensis TaxID=1287657 RepID=UPI003D27DBA6